MNTALALPFLTVLFPSLLGVIAGRIGLFREPDRAVSALNTFVLNLGFPALVIVGLVRSEEILPDSPCFWAAWPLALVAMMFVLRWLPVDRKEAATLGLVGCFGNVAYVGLPYVMAVYGTSIEGPAFLLISLHVALSVTVGPIVLIHWGSADGLSIPNLARKVFTLPLFWAPFLGGLGHMMSPEVRAGLVSVLNPLGSSAPPVALFMLGLYLYLERQRLFKPSFLVFRHVAVRLLLAPLLVLGIVFWPTSTGALSVELARLLVAIASVPVGITTFSMALDENIGAERVGGAIVWSSALALLIMPAWTWILSWAL